MNKFVMTLLTVNFALHADNMNVTGDSGMTVEMKTYYDKVLLKNAWPSLVHNQFGQKRNLPKGSGKIIEFRKFTPLSKKTTALGEGVTPDGQKIAATNLTATVAQYGSYVMFNDILETTTIDPVLQEATELLGHQAGETLDTLTREVLMGGTTVQYGDGTHTSRSTLVGQDGTWANNDYFNCEVIRRAMLTLRNNKARPLPGGDYVCIIHPDAEYTLKKDSEWVAANNYAQSDRIFTGEIGKFDGCRFVVSTEAKVFSGTWLTAAAKDLTFASIGTAGTAKVITVDEAITTGEATALATRHIWLKGVKYTIASSAAGAAGAATITVNEAVTGTPTDGEVINPGDITGDAAAMPDNGVDVLGCLFLGADAYGVTELEGMGLTTITKQLGSAGSADPLNQRSTQGWKATHVAKILSELWMVRAEVCSPFSRGAN
jgi:N4-gp56 family major capsid protein